MATTMPIHDAPVHLDITGDVCPVTWVKTKLSLEGLSSGEILLLRLNAGDALRSVPMSVKEEGHRVVTVVDNGDDSYTLAIRRDGFS